MPSAGSRCEVSAETGERLAGLQHGAWPLMPAQRFQREPGDRGRVCSGSPQLSHLQGAWPRSSQSGPTPDGETCGNTQPSLETLLSLPYSDRAAGFLICFESLLQPWP